MFLRRVLPALFSALFSFFPWKVSIHFSNVYFFPSAFVTYLKFYSSSPKKAWTTRSISTCLAWMAITIRTLMAIALSSRCAAVVHNTSASTCIRGCCRISITTTTTTTKCPFQPRRSSSPGGIQPRLKSSCPIRRPSHYRRVPFWACAAALLHRRPSLRATRHLQRLTVHTRGRIPSVPVTV